MPPEDDFQYTEVDDDFTFESLGDLQAAIDGLGEDLETIIGLGNDISDPTSGGSDWEGDGQARFRNIWCEGGWSGNTVSFEDTDGGTHSANDVSSALNMAVTVLSSLKTGAEVSAEDIIEADEVSAAPFE